MLHGNPTWCFMYRRLVRHLRSSYRVLAPDHIGCGLSEVPPPGDYPYTFERRLQDLENWLEQARVLEAPFHLMAHDWGGVIGSAFAVRHPHRIRTLTLFNTAAFDVPEGHRLHWSIRWCHRSRLARLLVRHCNLFALVASHVGSRRGLFPETRRAYRLPYDSPAHRIAIQRFLEDIPLEPEHPSRRLLLEVDKYLHVLDEKPICICWGERDFVFDRHFLREWKERFPEAEIHKFSDAGHYVLEDASGEISAILEEFLGRN